MATEINNYWWLGRYISNSKFVWRKRFVWWPQRSFESKKYIWLKSAWCGTKHLHGLAGEADVKLKRWLTDKEYVLHLLKTHK